MRQKELWLVSRDPAAGSEQKGLRPAVIISGESMNEYLDICIICPVTGRIKKYPGCPVIRKNERNGLDKDSEVLTFQVRVIAKSRLKKKLGTVTDKELENIKQGLFEVLTY
ncbi:MAG TPA: type II toxin-antitoxin system PemK/MazF family toxin [Bacteroidales bacterium]|nr:type II toxin-antitoxin system PemK/MazF family toxin [Bacteroidales bacterium]